MISQSNRFLTKVILFLQGCFWAGASTQAGMFESLETVATEVDAVDTRTNAWEQLGQIVNYFLGIVGLIMLFTILYTGVQLLTAQGNDEKVGEARKIIVIALAGVILIALAYALNTWIMSGIETP